MLKLRSFQKVPFLFCVTLLFFLVPFSQNTYAATITNISFFYDSNQCPALTQFALNIQGSFNTDDGNGVDQFALHILDNNANGNDLFSSTFSVPVGSTFYETNILTMTAPSHYPIVFWLYEVDQQGGQDLIYSSAINPCPSNSSSDAAPVAPIDPIIAAEQERGITRLFDDGVVIAKQLNGDFQYYLPNGCLIGITPLAYIASIAQLSKRYIVQSLEGCGGYRIDLWSLGYPACQLQINMYGPDGFERVYQLERQPTDYRCDPDYQYAFGGWTHLETSDGSQVRYSVAIIYTELAPGQLVIRSASLAFEVENIASPTFTCYRQGYITIFDENGQKAVDHRSETFFSSPNILGLTEPIIIDYAIETYVGGSAKIEVSVRWDCFNLFEGNEMSDPFSEGAIGGVRPEFAGQDVLPTSSHIITNSVSIP